MFFALALTLMFAPNLLLADWGIDVTLSVEVMGRRSAALFAGIAVMCFSARNAKPSVARSAVIKGVVVIFALLAALGLFEFSVGNVTPAILIPVFIEVSFVLAFVVTGCNEPERPDSRRI